MLSSLALYSFTPFMRCVLNSASLLELLECCKPSVLNARQIVTFATDLKAVAALEGCHERAFALCNVPNTNALVCCCHCAAGLQEAAKKAAVAPSTRGLRQGVMGHCHSKVACQASGRATRREDAAPEAIPGEELSPEVGVLHKTQEAQC